MLLYNHFLHFFLLAFRTQPESELSGVNICRALRCSTLTEDEIVKEF